MPEDMSEEHPYSMEMYQWDMKLIGMMRRGEMQKVHELLPQFVEIAFAEFKAGSLTWMCSAMGYPELPGELHGFGNVIGTGNAVFEWNLVKLGSQPGQRTSQAISDVDRGNFVSEPAIADHGGAPVWRGPGPNRAFPADTPSARSNVTACGPVFGPGSPLPYLRAENPPSAEWRQATERQPAD